MGFLDVVSMFSGGTYYGVSKAELNEIAAMCQYNSHVSISGDRLYYHFKSNRGHQKLVQEFTVVGGKLHPWKTGGPAGYSPDIKFMSICNSRFDFSD